MRRITLPSPTLSNLTWKLKITTKKTSTELKKEKFLKHLLRTMMLWVYYWTLSPQGMCKTKRMKVATCHKVASLEPWNSKVIKDSQLILKPVDSTLDCSNQLDRTYRVSHLPRIRIQWFKINTMWDQVQVEHHRQSTQLSINSSCKISKTTILRFLRDCKCKASKIVYSRTICFQTLSCRIQRDLSVIIKLTKKSGEVVPTWVKARD